MTPEDRAKYEAGQWTADICEALDVIPSQGQVEAVAALIVRASDSRLQAARAEGMERAAEIADEMAETFARGSVAAAIRKAKGGGE